MTEASSNDQIIPRQWGISTVLKTIFLYCAIIMTLVIIITLIAWAFSGPLPENDNSGGEIRAVNFFFILSYLIMLPAIVLAIGLIYYIIVKRHGYDFFIGLLIKRPTKIEIIKSILLGLLLFAMAIIFIHTFVPKRLHNSAFELPLDISPLTAVLTSVWILMLSISDEIIFRGFIYQGFNAKLPVIAAAIAATLFSFVGNYISLFFIGEIGFSLFFLSIILMWVRIRSNCLINCIITHGTFNLGFLSLAWISKLAN